jgi:hypothetical protein
VRRILLISMGFISLLTSVACFADQPKLAQWTVMIYINLGDGHASDRSPEDLADEDKGVDEDVIKLLEKTGSTDQMNIIVERQYLKDKYTIRTLIDKSNNPDKVTSPAIQNLGFVDMGNYLTLQDFITWGIKSYPAQHYMVIVNVHGDGWYDARKMPAAHSYSRFTMSKDNYKDSAITSPQLGKVMRHAAGLIGHKLDLLALDSCYMLDMETVTELADSTHLVIGSEDKVNLEAWPYQRMFEQIAAMPAMTPEQITKVVMNDIADLYKLPPLKDEQQTFAVIQPDQLPALNKSLSKLSYNIASIRNSADLQKILHAQTKTLSMMDSSTHYDLLAFIKELQRSQIPALDQNNLAEIEKLLNLVVIHKFVNTNIYMDED